MIEVSKKTFNIFMTLSCIGVISMFFGIIDFKESRDYQYRFYEGYKDGAILVDNQYLGYYEGMDYEGEEPTLDELLELATDSYLYEYARIDRKEDTEEYGFKDGYINMYIRNFIAGINSEDRENAIKSTDYRELFRSKVESEK